MKFANSSVEPQFPQSGILQPQFPQSDHTPQKRPIYVEICVEIFGEIFLGHPEHWVKGVFEKNGTQFGQLLPRWPHLQSATPYMASPSPLCTIFHNPDLKWNIVQQCTTTYLTTIQSISTSDFPVILKETPCQHKNA